MLRIRLHYIDQSPTKLCRSRRKVSSYVFNLQSLIPEKGVSRIGYAFGHNCKSIV